MPHAQAAGVWMCYTDPIYSPDAQNPQNACYAPWKFHFVPLGVPAYFSHMDYGWSRGVDDGSGRLYEVGA